MPLHPIQVVDKTHTPPLTHNILFFPTTFDTAKMIYEGEYKERKIRESPITIGDSLTLHKVNEVIYTIHYKKKLIISYDATPDTEHDLYSSNIYDYFININLNQYYHKLPLFLNKFTPSGLEFRYDLQTVNLTKNKRKVLQYKQVLGRVNKNWGNWTNCPKYTPLYNETVFFFSRISNNPVHVCIKEKNKSYRG